MVIKHLVIIILPLVQQPQLVSPLFYSDGIVESISGRFIDIKKTQKRGRSSGNENVLIKCIILAPQSIIEWLARRNFPFPFKFRSDFLLLQLLNQQSSVHVYKDSYPRSRIGSISESAVGSGLMNFLWINFKERGLWGAFEDGIRIVKAATCIPGNDCHGRLMGTTCNRLLRLFLEVINCYWQITI